MVVYMCLFPVIMLSLEKVSGATLSAKRNFRTRPELYATDQKLVLSGAQYLFSIKWCNLWHCFADLLQYYLKVEKQRFLGFLVSFGELL